MMSIILLKAKIKTQVDQPNNAHRLKTKLPDTDTISSIDSAKTFYTRKYLIRQRCHIKKSVCHEGMANTPTVVPPGDHHTGYM